MKKTYSLGKRLLALVVTLALVLTFMPNVSLRANAAITTANMVQGSKKVDPSTIHNWKQYFDIMSTEYVGGVWSDKSVFNSFADYQNEEGVQNFVSPAGNNITDAVKEMLATDPENFLVAMSAITANKALSGSTSAPMDNMLVLDVSGSMQGSNAVAVVEATNRAIKTLLDQNVNNRVGVILYSGNHNFGNSGTGSASVLLPLGRYTTTNTMNVTGGTIPAYLTISGSGDSQTVQVASSVNNGSAADSKTVRGGTYIQNGLYQAWQQFNAVTDTKVPEGQVQAGTQRTPVVVLMSDGAPTTATTSYNNVGQSNLGDGGDTTNFMGFVTQLTAAYVRGKVKAKYGTEPKFYSLGVGTGNSSIATSVLNPAGSNDTINGYWRTFDSVAAGQNAWISGRSVYKDAAVAGKNYVDQYWLTNSADGLINAFNQIVNTIVLASEQYSTLVDMTQGADLSGYVTFEDELGQLMEVKSVKGMVMGNYIYTGAELAKGMTDSTLGTVDGPTAAGDELVRTVKERMGITETTVAQQLIDNAFNAKQLNYVSATEYSNYIGWYADENGNYVGFWQESDGYTAENAPANAKYINKSYGYLGEPLTADGAGSDMMHIVVMVHTEIATGHQSVVYKIPAALLPSVTYHVELNGENVESPKTLTREAADPMRLLFEVGLRSDINPVNLKAKIAEHKAKGGHVHENNDGTYSFYTNSWGSGDGNHNVDYDEPLTHLVTQAHFNPALENDRYYHVSDDLVYADENGTVYTGTAAPSGTKYFARPYYEVVGGAARYTVKYAPINATVLALAQQGNGNWYIPKGTPHSLSRFAQNKDPNTTDTLNYSWNPVILHDNEGYHSYTFLGNNGTFRLAPAQGISITKTVTEKVPGASEFFEFIITLDQAAPNLKVTDADGNNYGATVTGNEIRVILADGKTAVLSGIPTGTTYTVTEAPNDHYDATIQNATGTVVANTVIEVAAENTPKVYNDLIVSKDVLYPSWMTDISALEAQDFQIRVQVENAEADKTYTTSIPGLVLQADSSGNILADIVLKDGQSATIYGLPAGARYTVLERNVPAGYTANATDAAPITGTISGDGNAVVGVVNTYAPAPAQTTITITGTKSFLTTGGYTVPDGDWPAEGFTVELYSVNMATGAQNLEQTVPVKAANKSWSVNVDLVDLDKTGSYNYIIKEAVGSAADIVYDHTSGLFEVIVVDDGTGTLKVDEIRAVEGTVTVSGNTVDKDFTNRKDAGSVRIPVEKTIEGSTTIPVEDFIFGLYDDGGNLVDTVVGNDSFVIAGYATDFANPKTYTIKEIVHDLENAIPGMTYDTTVYTVSVVWDATQDKLVYSFVGSTETTAKFKNTFDENAVSTPAINLSGKKTISGDRTDFVSGESYTFQLFKTGADFQVPATAVATDTVTGLNDSYNFPNLAFKEAGVYYYVVKEAVGTQGGVTYDTSEYHVTIHVTKAFDNNKAILVADAAAVKLGNTNTVALDKLDFNNVYTISQPATATISGTKTLTGRALIADEFEFGLYENGNLVESVKNATNGKFAFSTITYTAPGTHIYTVKEIVPTPKLGGVTYSSEEYTVTVTVTDNGAGGLNISRTMGKENSSVNEIVFTNTYEPAEKDITLAGNKTWLDTDANQDKTVPAGKFSFTLYRSNETYTSESEIKTVSNEAGGAFSFNLKYTKGGTHYYILRENIIKDPAVTGYDPTVAYDAGRYLIKDVVTDDGHGQLHILRTIVKDGVGEVNAITFGNLYTPVATEAVIAGTKNLTGRPLALQDGEFTFQLFEGTTLLQEKQNVGNAFTFDAISYEKSGTYTYKVVEKLPDGHTNGVKNGITYDQTEYTVTVTVVDDNGQLKATVSHTPAQLVFNNTYAGTGTQISVSGIKSFNKAMAGGEFTFELYEGSNLLLTQTNGASTPGANGYNDASFTFVIPLNSAGDHTFTLKEKNGGQNIAGVAYSPDEYTIKVTVTDDNNGQLVAGTPVITKGSSPVTEIVFQNSYSVAPTSVDLQITKKMIGDRTQLLPGETYSFNLYKGTQHILQAQNDQSGDVRFNGVSLDTAGTHVFTIKEVVPAGGVKDGVTYTTVEITATVEVTDNGDGTLTAGTPVYTNNGVLENTYTLQGPADFDLVGEKRMEGRSLNANDVFTFLLKDAAGNTVATAQNSGNIIRFEGVTLSNLGDHYFTVVEQAPAGGKKDGVTYSTEVYDVYVRVTDNGKGQMVASAPVVTKNSAPGTLTFTNKYEVTEGTTTEIVGNKTLTGKALHAEQFSFELYAGTDTTAQPIATVKNEADGTFKFQNVELNTLGTNTFTVIEKLPDGHVNGKRDGITYSNLVYTVTVETTDNGVGGMTAGQPVYFLGAVQQTGMEFINTYAVEGSVNAVIEGFKTLEGGKKLEENMFTFELYEGDHPTGNPIDRVQNAADGSIKFNLSYGVNDIGKHTYTVKEVAPEGYEKDGIRYTYLYYNVDIEVVDNNAGGLTAKAPVYRLGDDVEDEMEFVNVYTPEDRYVDLTIEKTVEILSGEKEVGPKGFKFKVADENGKTVATLTTDEDGKAAHTLTFTAKDVGKTFTYKITEIDTKKPGITYSDAVYEVSITIGQADSGELTTSMTVNGKGVFAVRAFFRNTYEAPELPQTGDSTDLTVYAVVMALSALGFVAMLVLRKKEKYAN